ncbi:AAA family ATPase [Thiohalorhabdus methylotrophus]|uniref:AAA family ATPase n=1 Tax=Thiohalorhabdus methylotrophus TaxID=3242694 RepID=A0ABV4TRK1_9GAMM
MKVRSLDLAAFGAFLDRRLEFPDGPAVVMGPNEAGKTTLFNALTTILYGFDPANEAQFPYTPRAGRRAELEADLVLDSGASAHVRRRLMASPDAQWESDGGREKLANRPLPVADHVDRRLYKAVYALTIEDMQSLEGEAFARVEQRLLGELGNSWQRPAREVAEELDQAAKRQWRRDKRGKSRHAELKKEHGERRKDLKAAKEHQGALREKEAERARIGERLAVLDSRRHALRARIERSESVGHLKRELERLDRLRESLGDPEAARALGADPRRDWEQLSRAEKDLNARRREWAEAVARERARRAAVTVEDRALLRDPEVPGLAAVAAKVDEAGDALAGQREAEERARVELMETAESVLEADWRESYGETLEALTPADLRARCDAAAEAREGLRDAERRLADQEPARPRPRLPRAYLVASLALAAAFGSAAVLWPPLAIPAVAAAAGAAAVLAYNRAMASLEHQEQGAREGVREALQAEVDSARTAQQRAAAAVAELTADLPLPRSALAEARPELADRLEALRGAWRRYRAVRQERERAEQDWQRRAGAVAEVLRRHGVHREAGPLHPAASALEEDLHAARRRQAVADEAREALADLARRRHGLRAEDAELTKNHEALAARLARAIPDAGSLEECLDRAGEVAAAYHRWQEGWNALREHYPDVSDPRARVALAGDDLLEDTALQEAREELEELDNERTGLREEAARLDRDLEEGRALQDVGLIQGRIADIEQEMEEAEREHDRLRLLERLVREADRRFREAHQPDVLRRASAYLADVTGGRYTHLLMEEGGGSDALCVRDAEGRQHMVDGESAELSRGTRDQVFFALRLAVADHLDSSHERLPLLLDEVLVHWDGARQEAGLQGLLQMAGDRQVVLFTCHREFGERMARLLNTEPLSLPGPEVRAE